MFHTNILALTCNGEFQQEIKVENAQWKWSYITVNSIIRGRTFLHEKYDSFSIDGTEDNKCLIASTCSYSDTLCAVSFALAEPYKSKLFVGRIQMNSYGIYNQIINAVKKVNDCKKAYSEYQLEIEKFWQQQLFIPEHEYKFTKIHSREIKLDKPKELGDRCFENPSQVPKLWSSIDYFPVVTIELK